MSPGSFPNPKSLRKGYSKPRIMNRNPIKKNIFCIIIIIDKNGVCDTNFKI